MRDAEKPASLGFGKRLEGVAASVVFAEMHGSKSRGLYPLNELSGSTHIVGTDAAVYGKHGDVYGRCSLLYVFYFGQEIAISFRMSCGVDSSPRCQLFRSPAWKIRLSCKSIRKETPESVDPQASIRI